MVIITLNLVKFEHPTTFNFPDSSISFTMVEVVSNS